MKLTDLPEIPEHITNTKSFMDKNYGRVLIGKWGGEWWLFDINQHHNPICWKSVRKLSENDKRVIENIYQSVLE